MSSLELALTLLSGVVSGAGVIWWTKSHTHDELVPRREFELLITMMRAHQESTVRELTQLRESVDRLARPESRR